MEDIFLNRTRAILIASGVLMAVFCSAFLGAHAMMMAAMVFMLGFFVTGLIARRRPLVIFSIITAALYLLTITTDIAGMGLDKFGPWRPLVYVAPFLMLMAIVHYFIWPSRKTTLDAQKKLGEQDNGANRGSLQ